VVLSNPMSKRTETTMPEERVDVIVGVDTHTDTHAAVVIDLQGRRLDVLEMPATPAGYRRLLA
jgi:hypothetical protein